jgi:hypothetical protein
MEENLITHCDETLNKWPPSLAPFAGIGMNKYHYFLAYYILQGMDSYLIKVYHGFSK